MLNIKEYDNLTAKAREIALKKSNDYGDGSLLKHGTLGIVIRMSDKVERLNNLLSLVKKRKVNESIEDTALDIINYAHYLIMLNKKKLYVKYIKNKRGEKIDSRNI